MKNVIVIVICCLFMLVIGVMGMNFAVAQSTDLTADSFLRIHIRANSNSTGDQNVKYKVKDKVVEYLTPILANVHNKADAIKLIEQNLSQISSVSSLVLQNEGYTYMAQAELRREYFPTRAYDDVVLSSGEYDSIIVNLGSGAGDNWWCVVYPPLCFVASSPTDTEDIVYRSKILEIIRRFFGG